MQLYQKFCTKGFDKNGVLNYFSLRYPDNYNFGYDVVDQMAKEAPNDRAVVWCDTNGNEKEFSFQDISTLSNKAANVFTSYGIKKGDAVLVILKRNYEYWYIAPALHKIGAIMIPATHMLTPEDISYRINTANIKAAVCTAESEVTDKVLKAQCMSPELSIVFGMKQQRYGVVDMTNEIKKASSGFSRIETKALEPMLIYFTSGTTGYPKAVMHDHTYTLSHIITAKYWQAVEEKGLHLSVAETGWGKASWGKIYGQWLCGSAVMVYDFDNFSPGSLLSVIERYKVTTFCAPPTVYRYFIKKDMSQYDLTALSHITTAGEALNPEVFNQINEQTGLEIMEGYGQTESTLLIANLVGTSPKPGSMGKPSPLYHIALLKENGTLAKTGEVGEIVVKPDENAHQHGILMNYCDDEKLYNRVWRSGMYHTGDTAYCDSDGFYWYVGRADDIIKTSGFRVGPFEIENILMEHPAVLECAATGVPDKNRGQAIKATVVLSDKYKPSKELENEIKTFYNSRTSSYKHIQKFEFVKEMPKTVSGKIRHAELRETMPNIKPYKRMVNYYETDKMDIVHHSNYFRYFEEARLDFMRQIGCSYEEIEKLGLIIPNIDAYANYGTALHYGNTFEIMVHLVEFNGIKMKFTYSITVAGVDEEYSKGYTSHCFVNQDFRPISIKRKFPELYHKMKNAIEEAKE